MNPEWNRPDLFGAGSRHDFVLSGHGQRLHLLLAQLRRNRVVSQNAEGPAR